MGLRHSSRAKKTRRGASGRVSIQATRSMSEGAEMHSSGWTAREANVLAVGRTMRPAEKPVGSWLWDRGASGAVSQGEAPPGSGEEGRRGEARHSLHGCDGGRSRLVSSLGARVNGSGVEIAKARGCEARRSERERDEGGREGGRGDARGKRGGANEGSKRIALRAQLAPGACAGARHA